jgi:hypothetical protein
VAEVCSARSQLRRPVGARLRRKPVRRQPVTRKAAEQVTDLIDPDRALREAAWVAYSDAGELFDEHGNLRPLHELPDHLTVAIASIKIVKRKLTAGDNAPHIIQTVRFWDKPKALETVLKYLGLLGEPVHRSGDVELVERLETGRKYAAGKT